MRNELLLATALGTSLSLSVAAVAVAGPASVDWSGPYVGVTAGVGASTSNIEVDYDYSASLLEHLSLPSAGVLGGVTAGYNVQLGDFVIGVEADGSVTSLAGSDHLVSYQPEDRLESLLSLRARLGVASGPFLAYGTFGVAGGHSSFSTEIADVAKGPPTAATGSGFATGVIGGGGVEYAMTENLSVKGEALVYSLGGVTGTGDTGKGGYTAEHRPSGLLVKTGVNLHF